MKILNRGGKFVLPPAAEGGPKREILHEQVVDVSDAEGKKLLAYHQFVVVKAGAVVAAAGKPKDGKEPVAAGAGVSVPAAKK